MSNSVAFVFRAALVLIIIGLLTGPAFSQQYVQTPPIAYLYSTVVSGGLDANYLGICSPSPYDGACQTGKQSVENYCEWACQGQPCSGGITLYLPNISSPFGPDNGPPELIGTGRCLTPSGQTWISIHSVKHGVCPDSGGTFFPGDLYIGFKQCNQRSTVPDYQKNLGNPICLIGNPIHPVTGNKVFSDMDVSSAGVGKLELVRFYNSRLAPGGFNNHWRHNFDQRVVFHERIPAASVVRPDGRGFVFTPASNGQWLADADVSSSLRQLTDGSGALSGWQFVTEVNDVEIYDATGKLLSITKPTGLKTALTYNANGQLSTVTDPFGRQLSFNYDGVGRISQISDASGGTYAYSYDLKGNLRAVNYPNGVAKTYHYENTAFPSALTGITDENGIRYATYAYDVTGRAISTQHAGGAEHYILSFGTNSTVVTDPLNTNRTDTFQIILGVAKHTGSSQPGGSGCGPAASALTYDPNNGNIATRTDFNGNLTTYDYDLTRNLEKKRVEASGKPETRTISTQWHAYWRLPTKVAEPKKLSTWVYNGDTDPSTGSVLTCAPSSATVPSITGGTVPIGVLCKQSEQSTTDANGSTGFTATVSGLPRTWTYTYNAYGQVLTADGPRTDVSDVTTTTYYAPTDPDLGKRGNLATVTNALGHVTQITAYDLNGNPLTIIDPNNVTTTLTYTPRGWLKSRTVGTELTGYKYDDVGQLTRVTQPDASTLTFTYDDAHRLTDLTDNLGNTVHYTLDAAGNRRNETIKDPWGTLTRQITRVYDALGRLQTVTGARQ